MTSFKTFVLYWAVYSILNQVFVMKWYMYYTVILKYINWMKTKNVKYIFLFLPWHNNWLRNNLWLRWFDRAWKWFSGFSRRRLFPFVQEIIFRRKESPLTSWTTRAWFRTANENRYYEKVYFYVHFIHTSHTFCL